MAVIYAYIKLNYYVALITLLRQQLEYIMNFIVFKYFSNDH